MKNITSFETWLIDTHRDGFNKLNGRIKQLTSDLKAANELLEHAACQECNNLGDIAETNLDDIAECQWCSAVEQLKLNKKLDIMIELENDLSERIEKAIDDIITKADLIEDML